MDIPPSPPSALESIPANRRLIDMLYGHGHIDRDARQKALNMLYPAAGWGFWSARVLLAVGTALVLSGVVYFFAFNWTKIPPLAKLGGIQGALFACLVGAAAFSLGRISGQILLLSAAVLVGVFLAVFGQIYQTSADSYVLFVVWAALIFPWVLLSNFAPLWVVWLVVTNVALVTWWNQTVQFSYDTKALLFVYMMLLGGTALFMRELWSARPAGAWLAPRWTRVLLVGTLLCVMLVPISMMIVGPEFDLITLIAGVLGLFGNVAIFLFYWFRRLDFWALSSSVLSWCLIAEMVFLRIFPDNVDSILLLLFISVFTLALFSGAMVFLRTVMQQGENKSHA